MSNPFHNPVASSSSPRSSSSSHSPTSSSRDHRTPPSPAFSRPPSTNGTTIITNSRYPSVSVRNLTTPTQPRHIPSTPPQQSRTRLNSPPSTLTKASNTALPLSPSPSSGGQYHSSPPVSFPTRFEQSTEGFELTPVTTPKRMPPNINSRSRNLESPFHDRHSIQEYPSQAPDTDYEEMNSDNNMEMINDEDLYEYSTGRVSGGKQKTMPGYQFSSLSPRGFNEKGEKLTFGGMLDELEADENQRPISEYRRSLYANGIELIIPKSTLDDHPDLLNQEPNLTKIENPDLLSPDLTLTLSKDSPQKGNTVVPVRPTFRKLYSLSSRKEYLLFLLPALLLSILACLIAPYMSLVIGDAFAVFAAYPFFTGNATELDKKTLRDGVNKTCLKLTIAGILALLINYFRGVFWVWYGESVAAKLRDLVYINVSDKSMEWFDLGMGMSGRDDQQDSADSNDENSEAVGAGGLMSKFTRETDDVRLATSLSSGLVVMNVGTFVLCFILAMVKSPLLALVTLSTIPLVVLTQIVTQVVSIPLYSEERKAFAEASTNIERVTLAISTVKVHNAQGYESKKFNKLIDKGKKSLIRQGLVWGISVGLTDFLLLGTFVSGFWYGAKIVRDHKASSGDVMTCFWACLFSATYLQQAVPHSTLITKGKNSLASLLTIIQKDDKEDEDLYHGNNSFSSSTSTKMDKRKSRPVSLRGIRPNKYHGEFNFQNISFSYPSRRENLVLKDISLFIPAGETTFIVGGSGSGKSTIASILLKLYKPLSGEIIMDNQNFKYLDLDYTKENIAAIQQGCILFDLSVHENVALGLAGSAPSITTTIMGGVEKVIRKTPKDVTRQEVIEACKMAMIHDFIESLPEGYETKLGTGGNSLSGGQRQRLAIAKAIIRDPTVLILDEVTSALDTTSRVQVFQNLKKWRNNKTTIVITHDLSQIVSDDFVYVMSNGIIAEQGFRVDLVKKTDGVFANMAAEQAVTPFPIKRISDETNWQDSLEEILDMENEFDMDQSMEDRRDSYRASTPNFSRLSARPGGGGYMDILDGYSRSANRLSSSNPQTPSTNQSGKRLSKAQKRLTWTPEDLNSGSRAPSRISMNRSESRMSRHSTANANANANNRSSTDLPRVQPSFDSSRAPYQQRPITPGRDNGLLHANWMDKDASPYSSDSRTSMKLRQRQQRTLSENFEDDLNASKTNLSITTHDPSSSSDLEKTSTVVPVPSLISLIRLYFPTLPDKHLLVIGCLGSIGHGITTPVWSFFLAKLMQIVGAGGLDTERLTKFGLIILGLCILQGFFDFLSEWALTSLSAKWSCQIRKISFLKLLKQDKSFFDDSSKNSSSRLVQILIKDVDDSRTLMSQVIGKSVTVITMISFGLIWAVIVNWQLTLIGLALAPLFGGFLAFNSWFISKIEQKHKLGREAVARTFYESISNIRGIRAMALASAFEVKFQQDAVRAKQLGDNAAYGLAMGGAVAAALPLVAQALMNYAGSVFMIQNKMNYQEMLQVYNLVLFSLTFGSAMLDFIPIMSKARVAARDFNRLYLLNTNNTEESQGELRYPIKGKIEFRDISFNYPTRSEVQILNKINFTLNPGECVAIVGESGSGKSTIASLLQRLYKPSSGKIILDDKFDLNKSDINWLRNHLSIVSQSTNLFNQSIAENISYGYKSTNTFSKSYSPDEKQNQEHDNDDDEEREDLPLMEIEKSAKLSNIHDFIINLPKGYQTNLGENANLISGGQAQRLQIARALFKSQSNTLILDECTSALDVDNAKMVLDTIVDIKHSRTTIFITHSIEAMKRCDRIICLGQGKVLEDGTFNELINKGGVFAQLLRTGEWE
ncbi:uncharacterized protein L201_000151 [Kwoniella dendrophila CBS 6074]|uniref:ATP-binding cassette, subfamily B (MDR/TAP), member 1 n=1 Tax=Kwoniella dendrophila CBS 6074 TaxID=1295534 RepID=A0AAX4JIJ7_9TREE